MVLNAEQDEIGMLRAIPFDTLCGVTALAETQAAQRYSTTSHVPQITMSGIWPDSPKWPRGADSEDEISNVDKIIILGGHPQWREMYDQAQK